MIGVRAGDVGFGLVVVIEADEILDRVFREKSLHLTIKLGGEGFVRGKDDRRPLSLFDDLCHREGFTRARGPQ